MRSMKSKKVALINLGCSKNLVDAEEILGRVAEAGSTICQHPEDAEVLIINTCGFVDDSKKESIDAIFKMAKLKEDARCKKLIVTGCLAQRYPSELQKEIPEIDHVVGLKDFDTLVDLSASGYKKKKASSALCGDDWRNRIRLTPKHYAYLRISDGCDNRCTYCAIPGIRGRFHSRTIENILEEAHQMAGEGVKEINVISQDTTSYGIDLYGKQQLHVLLEKLSRIEGIEWVRILYTHPRHFYPELISAIGQFDKICKYIDLPIQHSNDTVLKEMGRGVTHAQIESLIDELRSHIPKLFLRTSVIVGFPGETEEYFTGLLEFVRQIQFERLGVFTYSREEGTPAASLKEQVPKEIKEQRLKEVMLTQQEIVLKKHKNLVKNTISVIVDEKDETGKVWLGRTYGDAPDVDSKVIIRENHLKVGDIKKMMITGTRGYDLLGKTET
ncbi:Ribosomal protein S12 methylthiotransferase RimO [Candidatus Brocadiaceae bacterium B188]|nr:MAG: 30S ribosomal protein S12 methylthiotransferase RimO [Candidatus Brocadia sp. BROELEC01]TWU54035.1 Ribosomal protein S12 methylthiotransferase RimO [Candidatus Brocadiaceae bacterium B188]